RDGIRARLVTGVQTCALPIYENSIHNAEDVRRDPALWPAGSREASMDDYEVPLGHDHAGLMSQCRRNTFDQSEEALAEIQQSSAIGRASCRERWECWQAAAVR